MHVVPLPSRTPFEVPVSTLFVPQQLYHYVVYHFRGHSLVSASPPHLLASLHLSEQCVCVPAGSIVRDSVPQ